MIVERMTKFSHFLTISKNYKLAQVVELLFKEVFRIDGIPKKIVSDWDINFIRAFWQELFILVDMELTSSTNYHPQTDGQIEIVNNGFRHIYVTVC